MSGNYPPGVTGNEPQICGTGFEDKCELCLERADEDCTPSSIPDGEYEIDGRLLCEECMSEVTSSDCCGAPIIYDDICGGCKEHCKPKGYRK